MTDGKRREGEQKRWTNSVGAASSHKGEHTHARKGAPVSDFHRLGSPTIVSHLRLHARAYTCSFTLDGGVGGRHAQTRREEQAETTPKRKREGRAPVGMVLCRAACIQLCVSVYAHEGTHAGKRALKAFFFLGEGVLRAC